MKTNWDIRFMELARHIAEWSKDRNTKVGAVIVDEDNTILSVGYNGFTRGADDEVGSRHERPAKYMYTEHAERNAIYNAVRSGVALKGSKIYLPWFPCTDCARAIINSGIKTMVATEPDYGMEKWGEMFKVSQEMLNECGVKIQWYSDDKDEWNMVPKWNLDWDSTKWTDYEPSHYSQGEWNKTLITKINQIGAQIYQANQSGRANKIRVPYYLLPLIESLDYYDKEKRKLGTKYDVVVEYAHDETASPLPNRILVYYDGIQGRNTQEVEEWDIQKDCGKIDVKNYE